MILYPQPMLEDIILISEWHQIYNGILLSHGKESIWVSPNEVDEHRVYYTEWSQKEKNNYHILICICIYIYGL